MREDVRKWKHETRKQANMHSETAAGFRGTAQIHVSGGVTIFSKSRHTAILFFFFTFHIAKVFCT